jgi:3-oxoacyl-[acyl-carrier protein] reductase
VTRAPRVVVFGGATTRLGRAICATLTADEFDVVTTDGDACDLDALEPAAIVYASVDPLWLSPKRLVDVEPDEWDHACEAPLGALVDVMRAAYRPLVRARGALVVICPTLALQGAENFVLWSTVAEGQRVLAKSAARQWAADGVRVNIVSPPVTAFVDDGVAAGAPWADALRGRIPMGDAYDAGESLRGALRFLLGPDGVQTTGLTLTIDGAQVTAL